MNELIEITNSVANCTQNEVAKTMMTVFRAVTPQFYRNMTDNDLKAEMLSIKLLTQGIDQPTLAKMCELSVENYARARSVNSKIYFDINYLLTFYLQAFNKVHCELVKVPKGANLVHSEYDEETRKVLETYEDALGNCYEVEYIFEEDTHKKGRRYSPKFFETITNLDDVEL